MRQHTQSCLNKGLCSNASDFPQCAKLFPSASCPPDYIAVICAAQMPKQRKMAGMKILIVEDEPKTGDYLKQGLVEAGFVVDLVRDGLHAHERLVQIRCAGPSVRATSTLTGGSHQDRGCVAGQYKCQSASRRHWGVKKRPPSHWQVKRRLEHQDSYGCRRCSNGHNVLSVTGTSARCAR